MPTPILRVDGIRVERNGLLIIDGISWTIQRGQHWAVLGLNGAGKSTLLQVILAHLPASDGTIELLGAQYGRADWRELRKRVGIVSQAFALRIPPRETVSQIVASGAIGGVGTRRAITEQERKAAEPWLDMFGLTQRAEHPWRFLSQGERQRTLIARTFHAQPELIILDEPCAGLDPIARDNLLKTLSLAARDASSPSVIYVSHHVEEIVPMFTHVLGIAEGRVVVNAKRDETLQEGALTQIYQQPVAVSEDETGTLRLVILEN